MLKNQGTYTTADVAVAILNWNGKHFLEQFLHHVVLHSQEASIYLIDNASSDDSLEYVKLQFPKINCISTPKNGGFSYGYNYAIPQIKEPLVVLLNNDVQVTQSWLEPLISVFNTEKNVFAVQAKIRSHYNPAMFDYAGACGGYIDKLGYPYCRGRIFETVENDYGQYDTVSKIDWASGACSIFDKKIYLELGGLDELFFAHMEEIDLCWRARRHGYTVWVQPQSVIYHVGGGSLSRLSTQKTFLNFRNSLLMILKNMAGFEAAWRILCRLLLDGIAGIYFLFLGRPSHTVAIIRAHLSFYRHISSIIRLRKGILANKAGGVLIILKYFIFGKKTFNSVHS